MIVAAVVVLVVEYRRLPSRWIAPFLAVVLIGQSLLTNGIKEILDRARPTLNPTAHLLGPSFPSGHTATAAAFWAAVALLMGRARGRRAHAVARRRSGRDRRGRRRARVSCSTCTGSPTSSAGSRSGGPGSRSARSRSAVDSSASVLRSRSPSAPRDGRTAQYRPARRRARRTSVGVEQPGVEEVEERSRRRVRSGRAGAAGDARAAGSPVRSPCSYQVIERPRRTRAACRTTRTGSTSASSATWASARCSRARRRRVLARQAPFEIDHAAADLGVVGPRATVEVVGADGHPHVVDDAHLRVHVDRGALVVREVEDRDPIAAGLARAHARRAIGRNGSRHRGNGRPDRDSAG